jgi:NlpC/P60 family protein/dipeptidyl peptidase-like protein
MTTFDPRITPARGDIAAAHLKGRVEAVQYVEGQKHVVVRGRTELRKTRSEDSGLETELLFGQSFIVYEHSERFFWGQASDDECVGYVEARALKAGEIFADHKVTALATPLLPAPDAKSSVLDILPMNARVRVLEHAGGFARIEPSGFVFVNHLAPPSNREHDWVAVAQRFLSTPYIWGGKTVAGLDCSGLVQVALESVGRQLPRDTDLQEMAVERRIEPAPDLANLGRGDLVFWDGHVGIMLDRERLLHATSAFMQVVIEPLHDAVRRIEPIGGPITSVRRIEA